MYSNSSNNSVRCVQYCPDGYYENLGMGTCLPCITSNCNVCDGGSSVNTSTSNNGYHQCSQCLLGYFLIA